MNYFFRSRKVRAGTNRRFWRVWTPLSLIGFVAIYLAFILLEQVVSERLDRQIKSAADILQSGIQEQLERVYVDIDFLSNSQIIQGFMAKPDDQKQLEHINYLFRNIVKTHKVYDHIRLISVSGDEIARVNYSDGLAKVVPQDQLQNKSDRYYFTQALTLRPGEVFVSRLDLNIEHGQVETPFKPVIRFATPLFDDNQQVKAVIVMNFIGDLLLENFRSVLSSLPGKRMLLNSEGFWLSYDVREKEWGFMFNEMQSFKRDHPEIWNKISTEDSGIIETDEGRVRFYSIDPRKANHQKDTAFENGISPWKIAVINGDHRMGASFIFEHMTYLYPLLLAYPLGSILLWFWARADSGRAVAEQELVALNRSLENKVHRRTAELEATKDATILSLATLAETRDNETGQHVHRTQKFVEILAKELQTHPDFKDQLSDSAIEQIYKSAPLHDVGKVGIPDHILHKPGKLTDVEFDQMKKHTTFGSDAIEEAINSLASSLSIDGTGTFLHYARDIAHYHHERWDGSGYPKGLIGDNIPLAARIMAVADVYDALVSERVYKEAYSREKAEEIMINQSPGQFDPRIIEAFKQLRDQFWEIKLYYSDRH